MGFFASVDASHDLFGEKSKAFTSLASRKTESGKKWDEKKSPDWKDGRWWCYAYVSYISVELYLGTCSSIIYMDTCIEKLIS